VAEFIEMGGYGQWVWSAYGIALIVLASMIVLSLRMARQSRRRLEEIDRRKHGQAGANP